MKSILSLWQQKPLYTLWMFALSAAVLSAAALAQKVTSETALLRVSRFHEARDLFQQMKTPIEAFYKCGPVQFRKSDLVIPSINSQRPIKTLCVKMGNDTKPILQYRCMSYLGDLTNRDRNAYELLMEQELSHVANCAKYR